MKLVARIQKLAKKPVQSARVFSGSVSMEPEEDGLAEKKGYIYCVFDVQADVEVDPLLITKVVHDVLYDGYYGSESTSPIQALERAILDVRERVTHLPGLSDSRGSIIKDFNLLAVVFWGNVLYMVQFGRGGSFLVRDGIVKPVNSATEGSFSVASGVVKDADVVILGTESFITAYTPEDLVSGNISFSMHDLEDNASALLLKFEFVEEERRIIDEPTPTPPVAQRAVTELPKITLTKVRRKPSRPLVIGSIAVFLLAGSIALSLRGDEDNSVQTTPANEQETVESARDVQPSAIPDTSNDVVLKIERVDPAVFYDLKLADSSAAPADIAVLDSSVVVSDSSSGKLFRSSLTTSQFSEIGAFAGIKNIGYFGGDMIFTDNEGYKVWDGTEVTESYTGNITGPVAPYLAFLYEASGGKVTKYSFVGEGLQGEDWATSSDFDSVVSLAVDSNIYALSNSSLVKWYAGSKTSFEIKGLDKPLSNAVKVIKTFDMDHVYVADAGNQRVLILDTDGNLVKQILSHNDKFNDIKSIGVSPKEDTIFVLNGSKVYEIDL